MRAYLLCLISSLCVLENAMARTPLEVSPESQAKRDIALAWSDAVHSFSGAYTRTHIDYSDRMPSPGVPESQEIVYRYEGENRYMSYYSDILRRRDIGAFFNGKFVQVLVMDTPTQADITSKHFVEYGAEWKPRWPSGMIYPPPMVFQQEAVFGKWSLREYFAEGQTLLKERNGKELLIHRRPHNSYSQSRVEIEFDAQQQVAALMYAYDWRAEDDASSWFVDPLDIFLPMNGWRYKEYRRVNDIWFPLQCAFSGYAGGAAEDAIWQRKEAGLLTPCEAAVEMANTVTFDAVVQIFIDYDADSLIINEPLDAALFHIEVPADALELDQDGALKLLSEPVENPWWREHFGIIILAAALLLTALAVLLVWWRWFR